MTGCLSGGCAVLNVEVESESVVTSHSAVVVGF
jgi:hypothetical protein